MPPNCRICRMIMHGWSPDDEDSDLCDECHAEEHADTDDGSDVYPYEMGDA